MILTIDPGETSGWARFDDDGTLASRGQLDFDSMMGALARVGDVTTFVIEAYTHDPGRQKRGSTFKTVQVIGAIKLRALQLGAKVVTVGREAKSMGSIYTGIEPPANHKLSHEIDAVNLGTYWLVTEGIIDPPMAKQL